MIAGGVTGGAELNRQLADLETRGVRQGVVRALMAGTTVVERSVRGQMPLGRTGELRNSIGGRIESVNASVGTAKVGVDVGKRSKPVKTGGNSKAFRSRHAHLYILGTDDRYTSRGAYRGHVNPSDSVVRGLTVASGSAVGAMRGAILQIVADHNFATVSTRSIARLTRIATGGK